MASSLNAELIWDDVLAVRQQVPLVHSITNFVVTNYNANVLLALGAAPVMAHAVQEVADMVSIAGALVLNIGTLDEPFVQAMALAAQQAKVLNKPIVLDPVGAGATPYRSQVIQSLLEKNTPNIIRGNASEIMNIINHSNATKGVDSTQSSDAALNAASSLAKSINGVVCVSGETDYIVDANAQTIALRNGHIWMTRITGTGCSASAMVGAFAAVQKNLFRATVSAMAYLGVAGEIAAQKVIAQNKGLGTLQTTLLDCLQLMTKEEFVNKLKIATN